MLIITGVSADGLARGYYLWGPPTKASWEQSPAGYTQFFTEKIVENAFSIKSGNQTVNAKLDKNNTMTLSTFKPEKPSEKASVELYPTWQLAALGHNATKPSVDRGQTSRKSKETLITNPSPTEARPKVPPSRARNLNQSTQELYAKCSAEGHRLMGSKHKNVGFSRIEACARNGGQM
jgi:hypothetical protein